MFLSDSLSSLLLGVPYRRGYLLHGKPGSGKSTTVEVMTLLKCLLTTFTNVIQVVAGCLGLNVSVINLAQFASGIFYFES
jgi:hypothetical protein